MKRFFVFLSAVWLMVGSVNAQDQSPSAPSSIVVLDVDQMFVETQFGQRIFEEYRTQQEALAAEQRALAADLREEELDLAARRPDMDLEAFRQEAQAFDEKTQAIRRAQDARVRELEASFGARRDEFVGVTRPILEQIMSERGATAILDPRSVVLTTGQIDITAEAIARINAQIGDGQ